MAVKDNRNKKKYRIEYVDKVLDPVHGFIDLTLVEKEIIALPIFKRMQALKQLSLTNWVFPGAEHTRYMHSLGVMHIANMMALNLKTLSGKPYFNDEKRQLLRLAALLHDIGHYPLSHVTEHVYENNLLENADVLQECNAAAKADIDKLGKKESHVDYMKCRYTKPMHHELMGANVIESDEEIIGIIKKHCPFVDIKDITDIIVGCTDNPEISVLVQLVHSELDADGIDYIMRDATFSGTSYGNFELGLLLRNLVVKKYNGVDIVGVQRKGISVVDQYLIGKYFSYTQVIFNRRVAILGYMAEIFTNMLIRMDKSPYPKASTLKRYVENHTRNDSYLKFTDRTFWAQLDALEESDITTECPDLVSFYQGLTHYTELEMCTGGEVILTSSSRESVFAALKKTSIYQDLENKKSNVVVLFHSKGFTNQIPEREFRSILQTVHKDRLTREDFQRRNVSRLQEGVAVIEKGKPPKLLADDSRSLMSHLYKTQTYILREYRVN